jgi:hypothetical protein
LKEDVLEQLLDDYLNFQGYFTTHNARFRPEAEHSDYVARRDLAAARRKGIAAFPIQARL